MACGETELKGTMKVVVGLHLASGRRQLQLGQHRRLERGHVNDVLGDLGQAARVVRHLGLVGHQHRTPGATQHCLEPLALPPSAPHLARHEPAQLALGCRNAALAQQRNDALDGGGLAHSRCACQQDHSWLLLHRLLVFSGLRSRMECVECNKKLSTRRRGTGQARPGQVKRGRSPGRPVTRVRPPARPLA